MNMKKCTENDRQKLNDYLDLDPALNLFFIGDIENFGFDKDFQHVYIDEDEDGIHAAYLVYRHNLCLQSYEDRRDQEFVDRLIKEYNITSAGGESSLLDGYKFDLLPEKIDCSFAQMEHKNEDIDTSGVIPLDLLDIDDIAELQRICFPDNADKDLDGLRLNLVTGTGRYFGIRENDKLVSMAGSTAECRSLGMVVDVCTHPDSRGKGFATKCIAKLSNDLLQDRKMPCLFFGNPEAGNIYRKIGYEDIAGWSMRKK